MAFPAYKKTKFLGIFPRYVPDGWKDAGPLPPRMGIDRSFDEENDGAMIAQWIDRPDNWYEDTHVCPECERVPHVAIDDDGKKNAFCRRCELSFDLPLFR